MNLTRIQHQPLSPIKIYYRFIAIFFLLTSGKFSMYNTNGSVFQSREQEWSIAGYNCTVERGILMYLFDLAVGGII